MSWAIATTRKRVHGVGAAIVCPASGRSAGRHGSASAAYFSRRKSEAGDLDDAPIPMHILRSARHEPLTPRMKRPLRDDSGCRYSAWPRCREPEPLPPGRDCATRAAASRARRRRRPIQRPSPLQKVRHAHSLRSARTPHGTPERRIRRQATLLERARFWRQEAARAALAPRPQLTLGVEG